ncbi:MAG: hypothetical protein A2013_03305 [Tenericutes bacterium GWE2_38_8]|nr:MAG: hypothetical protein A2009_05260 [Tenericutes bacterium GWD2_38_27]OHE39904.1 MAG: hypothetical protein A2013_03305 [Tenericutes bacterium GWE2_38_8]
MKKKDIIWVVVIVLLTLVVMIKSSRIIFEQLTSDYPYLMGFIKTAILASMGELLVNRIKNGSYFSEKGIVLKFFVWGFLGMIFVLIFKVFASGVVSAQQSGLLPLMEASFVSSLLTALLISTIMNIFFAPTFMLLHRVTDGYIFLSEGNLIKMRHVKLNDVIERINFKTFISFVVLKTIPLFWIPAHTITFMLPENYRVLMAAYLSIALGIILTVSKSIGMKKQIVQ